MKRLEQNPGFQAYIVLNKDGVVLRWNQESTSNDLTYEKAIQYSHHVLDLYGKGAENIKDLFDVSGTVQITTSRIGIGTHNNFSLMTMKSRASDFEPMTMNSLLLKKDHIFWSPFMMERPKM